MSSLKWQVKVRRDDYPPMRNPFPLCYYGPSIPKRTFTGRPNTSCHHPLELKQLTPFTILFFFFRFYLRESQGEAPWLDSYGLDLQIFRDFIPFLIQPENREYPDLCQLLDLNESTLLENLRQRFVAGHIYTYVGSILIALNPFKFYPIYNPKYVRLYQNQRVGPILPPHIFAIADNAYYCMLKEKRNQVCTTYYIIYTIFIVVDFKNQLGFITEPIYQ